MKTEQKQLLNEICEANGFRIVSEADDTFHIIVDEWDGVRFAECLTDHSPRFTKNKIYRLRNNRYINDFNAFIDDEGNKNGFVEGNKTHFKPSTEEPYKAQLIKEAKERYGEIKEGDKFKSFSEDDICRESDPKEWVYIKYDDSLYLAKKDCGGACIHRKGKWAERVKEEPICIKNIEVGSNTIKFEINREYINPKSEGPMEKQNFLKAIEDVCKEYLK